MHRACGKMHIQPSLSSLPLQTGGIGAAGWPHARAVAARAIKSGDGLTATHVSLDSLPVHRLEPGHYVAPLLCSGSTSLPFAVGLELFSSTCQEETDANTDPALPQLPESEGLLSLQYVLDGRAQRITKATLENCGLLSLQYVLNGRAQVNGQDEPLTAQAGDTLLSRSSSGTLSLDSSITRVPSLEDYAQEQNSRSTQDGAEQLEADALLAQSNPTEQAPLCMDSGLQWDAAILTVMLEGSSGADVQGSKALQHMVSAWRDAPVTGTLSRKVVAGIIERAQNAAAAALSDNRSARSPATLDSRPGPFAQLQNALRSQGLVVGPAQQGNGQAGAQSAGAQSAIALPAAMQNLPSDAVQYIMSGILGTWFRQPSPAVDDSTPSVPSSMPGQHPHEARQSGAAIKRGLSEVAAFRLPNQSNRLALIMDPLTDQVPFTFGIEIFEKGHKTTPHTHPTSQELFFILAGEGEGFCDGRRFPVRAGDVVVFPPRSVHGIDVAEDARMYCLELMQPNDMFAEFVKMGQPLGGLADDDLCILAALGCGGSKA